MAEKKGKPQYSPTKKGINSFEEGDGKELFPELPAFFVDINQVLKDDPIIKAYEREYLYETEREWVTQARKDHLIPEAILAEVSLPPEQSASETVITAKESFNVVTDTDTQEMQKENSVALESTSHYVDPFASYYMTSAYFSKSWQDYTHKPCEQFEATLQKDIAEGVIALEKATQEQLGEDRSSTPPPPPPPRGERDKTMRVVKEFHQLFPQDDILIREAEQQCAAELFCEKIAKEIVNYSAELYTSRCFERIKEGYTAHSVWEELRDSVAQAFLPQDYLQLPLTPLDCVQSQVPYYGYIGDSVDKPPKRKTLPYSHHYLHQDVPSSLLLSASKKLELSASQSLAQLKPQRCGRYAGGRNAVKQHVVAPDHVDPTIGVGEAPGNVPIDEYCRYVVPHNELMHDVTQTLADDKLDSKSAAPRKKKTEPVDDKKNSQRSTGMDAPIELTKKRPRHKPPPKKSPPASISVNASEAVKLDDLTTAMKKVPNFYFSAPPDPEVLPEKDPTSSRGKAPSLDLANITVAETAPPDSHGRLATSRSGGRRSARGERRVNMINISGDNVFVPRDVEKAALAIKAMRDRKKELSRSKEDSGSTTDRRQRDADRDSQKSRKENKAGVGDTTEEDAPGNPKERAGEGVAAQKVDGKFSRNAGEKKSDDRKDFRKPKDSARRRDDLPLFEITTPVTARDPEPEPDVGKVKQRSPHKTRLMPEESKKVAERLRQRALQEQREREKHFVIQLQQPEEIQNHIDVRPEAGVQVRRPAAPNTPMPTRRPGAKSRKDEPQIVADGGEYIISDNKQRWTDSSKGSNSEKEKKLADEKASKQGGTKLIASISKPNPTQSKLPEMAAKQKRLADMANEKNLLRRSVPKITKPSHSGDAGGDGRVVVAQSSHKSADRVPQLPFLNPSKRNEDMPRQTRRSSLAEQQRLRILTSALNDT